jgi:hypothetical protein
MPALEALLLRVKKKYPHPFAIIHNAPLHVVRFLHLQVAAASLGVAVLPARDNEQAARLLARLCNTKKMIGSASVKENEAIAPLRDDDAVSVAAELPGVSPALAVKLLGEPCCPSSALRLTLRLTNARRRRPLRITQRARFGLGLAASGGAQGRRCARTAARTVPVGRRASNEPLLLSEAQTCAPLPLVSSSPSC